MWYGRHVLFQHVDQAGFANARLSTEQDNLAKPILHLPPALLQQGHFLFPPDQGRQAARGRHLQATLHTAGVLHAIYGHGQWDAFERIWAQFVADKIALDQAERGGTHRHRIRHRYALQPRRNVWRVSQGKVFMTPTTAHLSHYHGSRMQTNADGYMDAVLLLQAGIESLYGGQNPQPGMHRPLRVVFMGLRPAKIHQQTSPRYWAICPS